MTVPGSEQALQWSRPSVMSLTIKDRAGLYAAYMPFLQRGGIFVPGARPCQLGDEVFLLLTLMQDETRYPVAGKVAWITPRVLRTQRVLACNFLMMRAASALNAESKNCSAQPWAHRGRHTQSELQWRVFQERAVHVHRLSLPS